jgi:hypothetical protein
MSTREAQSKLTCHHTRKNMVKRRSHEKEKRDLFLKEEMENG